MWVLSVFRFLKITNSFSSKISFLWWTWTRCFQVLANGLMIFSKPSLFIELSAGLTRERLHSTSDSCSDSAKAALNVLQLGLECLHHPSLDGSGAKTLRTSLLWDKKLETRHECGIRIRRPQQKKWSMLILSKGGIVRNKFHSEKN